VQAFLAIHGAEQAADLLNGTVVATIGPAALDAALRARITPAIASMGSTMAELVDAIVEHQLRKKRDS
jgi:uroporphyrinogen-III synthase